MNFAAAEIVDCDEGESQKKGTASWTVSLGVTVMR